MSGAQFIAPGLFRSWDNNGNPLAFGFLSTYAAGTTIPQATYTDSTLATQNNNPVQLNFRGESAVWLNPLLMYKLILTDANSNTIWTQDNVPGGVAANGLAIGGNLTPGVTNTYGLGTSVLSFANAYFGPNNAPVLDPISGNIGYYARTPAETAASVTPTDYAYIPYYAQRYGFLPSASAATNTTALQNCFNAMAQALTNVPAGGTYPDSTYSGPILVIPDGQYNINAAVAVPAYCLVRANKVLLVQTNSSAHHLTCSNPYRIDIEGITFQGGASAWSATGVNTDTSRVRFARCDFQTANVTNYAISQNMQTCNTLIEDCLVTNSPLFVDCNGDFVTIRNCWVNGYLYSTGNKPNNTASVNNRARNMLVEGGSWVPESVGTSTGTRWFNNQGGLLHIVEVQFGAEGSGGLPIVYEFGNCAQGGSPSISVSGTIIEGGQIACGNSSRADRGVINLQGAVPGLMVVKDAQFVAFGQIVSSQGFTSPTLAAWLSSNIFGSNYKFSIDIENIGQEPTVSQLAESVPPELLPFATISYGPRGSYPGFRVLGPLNNPVQEYFPNWANAGVGAVQGAVCGENTNPPSASFFTILTVSKTANGSGGDAACVVEIDISVVGEVAGPIEFMNQAKFRVAILAGRGNTIGYNVTTVNQDNLATGGASPGNILSLQMASLSTTNGAIQLKINTTLSASSTLACWRASIVSAANSAGFGFSLASS